MSRYIDADALCEHLQNKLKTDYEMGLYNHGALTESFIRFVEIQPTADAVEVVRCKDCIHSSYYGKICHYSFDKEVMPDHYCSYGERKEK